MAPGRAGGSDPDRPETRRSAHTLSSTGGRTTADGGRMITRFNSLAPRRKILVAGVALLVFAVAGTAAVAAVSSGDHGSAVAGQNPTARDPLRGRPGPVLLVPGYGGSTGAPSVLAGQVRASGPPATAGGLPRSRAGRP